MPIEIKHLDHVYMPGSPFETKALNDVTLDIHDGEFIGLIGHTGSGKSTLVQHLNGLMTPDPGSVKAVSYTHLKVTVELSPYDLTRGRITWRSKG